MNKSEQVVEVGEIYGRNAITATTLGDLIVVKNVNVSIWTGKPTTVEYCYPLSSEGGKKVYCCSHETFFHYFKELTNEQG